MRKMWYLRGDGNSDEGSFEEEALCPIAGSKAARRVGCLKTNNLNNVYIFTAWWKSHTGRPGCNIILTGLDSILNCKGDPNRPTDLRIVCIHVI